MRHPSIRFRLLLGTGLALAVMLTLASLVVYRAFERGMAGEIEGQLIQNAFLLAKSSELEETGLVYEWQEAMGSPGASHVEGLFTFWDLNSDRKTKSPDLGDGELPFFHGVLNEPVMRDIELPDGRAAKAVGLLHYPFTDQATEAEAANSGHPLRPEAYPQVVVVAREVHSLERKLTDMRLQLIRGTVAVLIVTWGAIFLISTWSLRPIRDFSRSLAERDVSGRKTPAEIPDKLPSELLGLAGAFNKAIGEMEMSREREKEFVLHAAHELRTPVAGIMATLEQAVMRPRESADLAARIREALHITSGMRLTLDSLMRLARLRGNLQEVPKTAFDAAALVREIIEPLALDAADRKLALRTDFPEECPMVNDPGLFRVLVLNLADNAIHHSPPGAAVAYTVEVMPARFVFTTRNDKGGLTEADLARVFEPFQRASAEQAGSEGHAGLGLSLAREAAHLLGGQLHAEIDGGAILFIATLPR